MRVITLDGPSKVGKTCIGRHIASELSPEIDGPVRFDSIGDFYRRITVAVIEAAGPSPDEAELLDQLQKVLDGEAAYDNERDWGDLHSEEVEGLVSRIGHTDTAQAAKWQWGERALGAVARDEVDLWVLDGRNPRRTIAKGLAKPGVDLILDLFVHAELAPSARRAGVTVEHLSRRREQDQDGSNPLLVYPALPVMYEPVNTEGFPDWFIPRYHIERMAIESSWVGRDAPSPVLFDTSEFGIDDEDMGLERMLKATRDLAHTALDWYNERNV